MRIRGFVVGLAALAGLLSAPFVAGCKSNAENTSTGTPGGAPSPTGATPPVSSAVARVQVQVSMRTSDHLAVLRDVFDGKASAAVVRAFFDPGAAGDAPANAQFDNVTKLAKDGWKVQRYEVRTIRVADDGTRATAEVFEWLVKSDAAQCRTYGLPWTLRDGNLYREAAVDVRDAACPTPK